MIRDAVEQAWAGGRTRLQPDSLFWRKMFRAGVVHGPEAWVRHSPPVFGMLVGAALSEQRQAVRQTLRQLMGPRPPAEELRNVAKVFTNYACCMTDALLLGADRGYKPIVDNANDGADFKSSIAQGKGLIIATAHTAGWDVAGPMLSHLQTAEVMVVMQREQNNAARQLHDEARRRAGVKVVHVGDDPLSALPLLQHLRHRAGVVAMKFDRSVGDIRGRAVTFLGEPWQVPDGIFRLAALSGAPILPVFTRRRGFPSLRICDSRAVDVAPTSQRRTTRHGSPATGVGARIICDCEPHAVVSLCRRAKSSMSSTTSMRTALRPMGHTHFDVVILGGGLAGNMLARQLSRQCPKTRVGLFERRETTSFKVGESTVELASHYMINRLGLSNYLYQEHLPKNGLRFFFDNAERNASLYDMSEMGTSGLPLIPSFQLDRSRLESHLLESNAQAGVTVIRGARARHVTLSEDGAPHQLQLWRGDERCNVTARWLVDATGRASVLAKKLSLREPETHAVSAVWGRFRNVADLDDIGPQRFRERVRHTSRVLSTNHFCYPGYWIWFIPLRGGITSVGVVIDRDKFDDKWRSEEGFVTFLRSHGAVATLLKDAQLLDVMSHGRAAYGCKQFFSENRWAVIGEAAAFTDPLYSPGSDFMALSNDFVVDLIEHDAADDVAAVRDRAERYNKFMRYRYEGTMRLYRNLYQMLGSYELFRLKWDFDIACYYNLWLEPYLADKHLDPGYLDRLLQQQGFEMAALDSFANLFVKVHNHLLSTGDYRRSNLGEYLGEFEAIAASSSLGTAASLRSALRRTHGSFNRIRNRALDLLEGANAPPSREALPMSHFLRGRPLA